ncbi:MAG: BamA/TamA family outer membrane protein [Fibrobacter sp.]|nr:BamA/TamA family outer membrane protein [Fibrobacter sp.]
MMNMSVNTSCKGLCNWIAVVLLLLCSLFDSALAAKSPVDATAAESACSCRIQSIVWNGERSEFDESQMSAAVGAPCEDWRVYADKLVRYYEDRGFLAAQVNGNVADGVLTIEFKRGAGYVWAAAENLDSSGTKSEVFRRLSGIEEGEPVSLTDLERSERKLSRVGYFEMTAPTRLFRDPVRNRIYPAFSMRKANVSEAEGVLTYSSEDNVWEGQIDVNLYNIAGTARDLTLEGFTGEDSRHLQGSYKEPWIFGTAWNVVLRGLFDEETVYEEPIVCNSDDKDCEESDGETIERLILGEVGVTRDIGFDFTVGVFFGITEDDKHSTFEMSYVSLDRFVLPRRGLRLDGSFTWKMDRPDSLDNYLNAHAHAEAYFPLYGNFIARYEGAAGGIFPTDASLMRTDLFALGGLDDFKGLQYHALRSRAYGFSELAVMWQDGYDLSIELFYQPGLYRRFSPGRGWAREQDYGVGFTQYRKNWSVNLYYALRNGCDYLDGILGFGVKTLF